MSHDLVNGDTTVNWARGTDALLPKTPITTSMGYSKPRLAHLRKIVKRAARGDTNALGQMRRVQRNLNQRAVYGDTKATALLQRISAWYAKDAAGYRASLPSQITQPFWSSPVAPPSSTADVYYPASSSPAYAPGSSDDYDEEAEAAGECGASEQAALVRVRR